MSKVVDITGQRFNFLVAIRPYHSKKPKAGATFWLCKCDCGSEVVVRGNSLRSGKVISCGCYRCMTSEQKKQAKEKLKSYQI